MEPGQCHALLKVPLDNPDAEVTEVKHVAMLLRISSEDGTRNETVPHRHHPQLVGDGEAVRGHPSCTRVEGQDLTAVRGSPRVYERVRDRQPRSDSNPACLNESISRGETVQDVQCTTELLGFWEQ
jgi:hypothetical protein